MDRIDKARRLERMTFIDAVTRTRAELTDGLRQDAGPAAFRLVIDAWPMLAEDAPAWDVVGLAALDISDRLFPDYSIVVDAAEPGIDRRAETAAVHELATELTAWCSRRASMPTLTLSERLKYDAAAAELRRALTALP
jgi:hypothetical protein